jgi:hypothetical protein
MTRPLTLRWVGGRGCREMVTIHATAEGSTLSGDSVGSVKCLGAGKRAFSAVTRSQQTNFCADEGIYPGFAHLEVSR